MSPLRGRDLEAFYSLTLQVGNTLNLDKEIEAFLDWLGSAIRPRWAALFLADEAQRRLQLRGLRGAPAVAPASLPMGDDPWQWLEEQDLLPPEATRGRRYAVPVTVEGRLLGVLCVVSGKKRASQREQNLVAAAAAYLGPVIRNIARYERLREELLSQVSARTQAEALFRSLVEQTLVGVALLDAQGRFTYVNPALAHMLGEAIPNLMDRPFLAYVVSEEQTALAQLFEQVYRDPQASAQRTLRLLRKDGREVHAEVAIQPVTYRTLPHILVMATDITERVYAEEAYHAVAERTPTGMTIMQEDRIVYANPAFAHAIGYPLEEIYRQRVSTFLRKFIAPEDREQAMRYLRHLEHVGAALERYTFRYVRPDGTVRWAQAFGTTIRYRGKPAVLLTYIDITALVEAREAVQRRAEYLQTLYHIVTTASRAQDLQGLLETTVDLVMKALEAPIGGASLTPEVSPQQVPPVLRGFEDTEQTQEAAEVIQESLGQITHWETAFVIDNWEQAPPPWQRWAPYAQRYGVRASLAVPIGLPERPLGVLFVADTKPRSWQEEEIRLLESVGQEVAESIERLRLIEDLQEALQAKEEMIQNVSHELRTPLTLIRGYLELLMDESLGPLTPEQREAVQVMLRNADRQQFMIDRLLLMQQLRDWEVLWEPIRVAAWFQELAFAWRTQAEEAGITLEWEVTPQDLRLQGDRRLLTVMMDNLIHNAIKFSPNGGTVRLRAWRDNDAVVIAVSDEGIGIPPDQLARIFERFYQVSRGLSRRFEGLGIGLSLCAEIVAKHRGRIWAESKGEGQGATFYVRLPALL